MNQGEQYYFTVNINYDYILSTTTTTTTTTPSTSTKPTSNGTSTTTNEMDGTRRVGQEKHCSTVPTTTSTRYQTLLETFCHRSIQRCTQTYQTFVNKQNHIMHALHNTTYTTHTLRSANCTQRTTWESGHPVPQLARSGPYSHDGERAAQSQITITNHKQAHCISPPLHTDQHLLATLDKKT